MSATDRSYRGRTTEERRAVRRAALLEAGIQTVGDLGWPGVTLKQVCLRAGLTERYFYESFDSLSAFNLTVVDHVATETEAVIVKAIQAPTSSTPPETVRAVLTAVWRLLLDDTRRGRVAALEGFGEAAAFSRRHRIEGRFAQLLAEHSRQVFGLRPTDPSVPLVSAAFVGASDEAFRRLLAGEVTTPMAEAVDLLVSIFVVGVPTMSAPHQ